jgi:hypothetical protein
MASQYSVDVEDLVLFFRDEKGTLVNRCVPYSVYTDERLRVDLDSVSPGWKGSVLSEQETDGEQSYYTANLSRLNPPSASSPKALDVDLPKPIGDYRKTSPGPDDLVIVPHDRPGTGFLVSQNLYRDCPTLPDPDIADMRFMAEQEGVVIANVPKFELTGITCYMLSLSNLRKR